MPAGAATCTWTVVSLSGCKVLVYSPGFTSCYGFAVCICAPHVVWVFICGLASRSFFPPSTWFHLRLVHLPFSCASLFASVCRLHAPSVPRVACCWAYFALLDRHPGFWPDPALFPRDVRINTEISIPPIPDLCALNRLSIACAAPFADYTFKLLLKCDSDSVKQRRSVFTACYKKTIRFVPLLLISLLQWSTVSGLWRCCSDLQWRACFSGPDRKDLLMQATGRQSHYRPWFPLISKAAVHFFTLISTPCLCQPVRTYCSAAH